MRDLGWITDEEFEQAFYEKLEFSSMPSFMGREGGWYLEEVRRQLIDLFTEEFSAELGFDIGVYGEDIVYEQGLTVHTSMEPVQQILADKAFRRGLEEAAKRQGYEGAIAQVSINDVSAFLRKILLILINSNKVNGRKPLFWKRKKQVLLFVSENMKGFYPSIPWGGQESLIKPITGGLRQMP